ncbi:LCP family protein [Wansuia hejianensis]|uniref:LCP family protein n=1 Tax=Wansuia hejianensis TaxID=2763667 RepID=A0A7G9GDC6_9FIRM|nr:LCP family protein [Wansuia hejianensis]QNM08808.1 LCP family protein [Wansuia hejianensis]
MDRKKQRKNTKAILCVLIIAVLVIIVAAVFVSGWLRKNSGTEGTGSQDAVTGSEEPSDEDSASEEGIKSGEVSYNGKKYTYNSHLSNFLFIGVDTSGKKDTAVGHADAGQADTLFLLSWNRKDGGVSILAIPRDTMTDIETFDLSGESLGKSRDHISLSYAFGDGGHKSCKLTKEAVSNLFYGLPIQGYCSVNLECIPTLANAVGELTVTVPDESLEAVSSEFQAGSQVILNADNTETFLRYRDVHASQSAINRQGRQVAYLTAYLTRARELFGQDAGFASQLFTDLQPYMVTNMGNDLFVDIMGGASGDVASSIETIPGDGGESGSYDEYRVDDTALYELILDTFYTTEE